MSVLETTTSLLQAEPLASSSQAAPLSYEELIERVRSGKENERRSHFKPHPKKRRPVSVIIIMFHNEFFVGRHHDARG